MDTETRHEDLKVNLKDEDAQNINRKQKATLLRARQGRIEREIGQSATLPTQLRQELGDALLFAFCDLGPALETQQAWLVLGAKELSFAKQTRDGKWDIVRHARSKVRQVKESPGLSLNRVTILGDDNDVPLMVVRYTNRQKKAMSHILFILEQDSKPRDLGSVSLNPKLEARLDARSDNSDESLANNKASSLMQEFERFRARSADEIYADSILEALNESQTAEVRGKSAVVWRLLGYLWPHRGSVAIGFIGAIFMTLLGLVPPFLTGRMIDHVIKPVETGKMAADVAMGIGKWTIMGLAVTYIAREFFAWVRLRWMSTIGELVASDLREEVYNHLHMLSLSYFSSKQTGSLISRVSSDTDRIWDFIAFGVVEVTTSILMLTGLSVVLILIDWRLGLMVTLPIPLILISIVWHGDRMQGLFLRAWRKWSHLTDCLSDTIPGVRVVKAFNREKHEMARFAARNQAVFGEFLNIHKAWTSFWPALMLTIQTIVLMVWFFGLPRVLGVALDGGVLSRAPLRSGEFISFVLYMAMFVQPIEVIGQMARMINRATSSAFRVFEVLDTEPLMKDGQDQMPGLLLDPVQGQVEFENVYFSYDGVRPILKNLSFCVQPGEMIGLVGPSGSGKTTVINLLARFYDVIEGKIKIDGISIQDLECGNYRRQIGMVLQDPYLFHGSILENIRYSNPDASLSEVIEAARVANAHGFISRLPHAYDTVVGERGHTLSGGERQRISIARAVLSNPRILILDEATSAVDTETEKQIQEALDRLVRGRTVFAIAHRLSTLTRADRLLVMKDGRLVEMGTHAELLKNETGVFTGLYKLQEQLHNSRVV